MPARQSILVAEDNADDTFLLKRAFTRAGFSSQIHFVRDGQEAIDYLTGSDRFADRGNHPLPYLLLLDLKMPRMSGFNVIEWVRQHPGFRRLLIIVLTASSLPEDVNRAYDLGLIPTW